MRDQRRVLSRALKQHLEGLQSLGVTVVPANRAGASGSSRERRERLERLASTVAACTRCPLYRTRTHPVISDGSPSARLVFIGEAPGREEDLQGKPFVGAAGQLLTKMINAMGFAREEVYICNVLKDRPPGNRTPLPEEMEACFPFLEEQLAIVRPKVICTLGAVATKALLGPHVSITRLRGTITDFRGTPLVPTFHPAYLLRNPPAKKFAWADLKTVKKLLEEGGR
jgi:DNA polymerase